MRNGADLFVKNANGKTPREEVELVTTVKGTNTGGCGESDLDPDYYKTLSFLSEREERIEELKGNFHGSKFVTVIGKYSNKLYNTRYAKVFMPILYHLQNQT